MTEELGRDIIARLREIAQQTRPTRLLPYEVTSVEFHPTGSISPDDAVLTGPPGVVCRVSVRVLDLHTGRTISFDAADWPVGQLLETVAGEEVQRSAFAWMLHANLDEWWLTGRDGQ